MSTQQLNICLGGCSPVQILTLTYAINDINAISVFNDCAQQYDPATLQYSYSIDDACWTCFMTYDELLESINDLGQDFFIKIKIQGPIGCVCIDDEKTTGYSTSLDTSFNFQSTESLSSTNVFNPYANLEGAISLQQNLTETVGSMFGVPIYYFKLSPSKCSKDLTFKEYALMNVEAVKQIKLIIADGNMPSSKPEFSDFGLDWQTDWETEIAKGMFATAFGVTAQPMEGDLVYIPMMKRMWMVNNAYEEKKDSLMWNATTFKVVLVKYEEKDSVDLGDTQDIIDSLVKNKYEDLFGDPNENENLGAGEEHTNAPLYAANSVYAIFESDAVRAYMTCDTIDFMPNNKTYYKGTLISDNAYRFTNLSEQTMIEYQHKFSGCCGTLSFILCPNMIKGFDNDLVSIGNIKLRIKQSGTVAKLSLNIDDSVSINLSAGNTYLVALRWSKDLNIIDLYAYKYTHIAGVPEYKLQNAHYYYDIDNPVAKCIKRYNDEFTIPEAHLVRLNGMDGWITNFKLFKVYIDNISEILQMYPTHSQLLINDTARKLNDLPGVAIK